MQVTEKDAPLLLNL